MAKPELGYWKIRGLAQPIRTLLVYAGEDFTDKTYEQGDAPDFSREKWLTEKPKKAEVLDFPNLPYYIDENVSITQSNAILKHVARKYKLDGSTDQEKATVDMLLDVAMDLRNQVVRMCYNKDYEQLKGPHFENVKNTFALYEKKLSKTEWFAGDKVTVADFHFYEMMFQHEKMSPGCLDAYPKLKAFVNKFENLPKVKEYLAQDSVKNMPVNNKVATFK